MNIIIRVLLFTTFIVCLKEESIKPKLQLSGQILVQNNNTLFRFQCSANDSPLKHHAEFRRDSMTLNTLRLHKNKCYDRYGECTEIRCKCGLVGNTFTWTTNRSDDVNFPKKNSETTCMMKFRIPNGHIIDATTGIIFNGSDFVPSPKSTQYVDFGIGILKEGELGIINGDKVEVILEEDKNNNHNESAISFLEYVAIITVAVIVVTLTIAIVIYCLMNKRGTNEHSNVLYCKYSSEKEQAAIHGVTGSKQKGVCKHCGVNTQNVSLSVP